MGKDFIQLTGNDDNAFEFNKRGGVGAISVTANIAPRLCSDFQKFSISNNNSEIKEAEKKLTKFYNQFITLCLLKVIQAQ